MSRKKHLLADTNVASLAFINHLFKLLPSGVRVCGQSYIQLTVVVLLEGNRPVDEVQVDVVSAELCQRFVKSRLDILRCVEPIVELRTNRVSRSAWSGISEPPSM